MILFNFKYMYILIMYVQWMLEMYKFFSLKSHAMYYLLCILKSNKNIIYMYISKIDVKSMILIPGVLYGQNIFVVDVCEIF